MHLTVFDGEKFTSVSGKEAAELVELGQAGASQPRSVWVDICVSDTEDGAAIDLMSRLGVDADAAMEALRSRLDMSFTVTPEEVHGAAWVDDGDGTRASQVRFNWNAERLVTVRKSGDAGMAFVREEILERFPDGRRGGVRLLADVLELMMVTVQRGLTDLAVRVGELNLSVLERTRPDSSLNGELSEYQAIFYSIGLRFPTYLVNLRAALIDPPKVRGTVPTDVELLRQYASIVDSTQLVIDSVDGSIHNVARDLQAQAATWQGNQINALTALATVFIPVTFITSYFGMNFDWMVDRIGGFGQFIFFGVILIVVTAVSAVAWLRYSGYDLSVDKKEGKERARSQLKRRR